MSGETDVEMAEVEAQARVILEQARVVAVLGAHVRPHKPAFYVPDYLVEHGYRVLPVNPVFAGAAQWGETFVGSLGDLATPVDVVDVFRRSSLLPEHLDEILGLQPLPRWVWFQLGVRNDEVAGRLRAKGIGVVQDRCMLADHRRLLR